VEVVVVPLSGKSAALPATSSGVSIAPGPSLADLLDNLRPIDTLIVGGGQGARARVDEPQLLEAVRALAGRARRVASVCTGAFILAASGLLNGRRASTHWRWCEALARDYPDVQVVADAIYTRDGNLWTSAGITAGMDLALALVEQDFGDGLAGGAGQS
jgi:transcriptional regulator GlxA family with amidase domain